jgi:hypothetical protein
MKLPSTTLFSYSIDKSSILYLVSLILALLTLIQNNKIHATMNFDCGYDSYFVANKLSFEMTMYQNGIARFIIDEPNAVKRRFSISSLGVGVEEN